ncbi:unnamed protein product [Euphydryas editha]|uniref:Uncharacterized protein n=1 Tax=Euphydryas editha TaxID=104508 RepID=A0AAU9UGI4_EUPED|nr:unnamed protein product [Euphydryas editha]
MTETDSAIILEPKAFIDAFVLGWVCKNIILLSLCIKECENFYTCVKEAEIKCLLHSENNESPGTKKLYKNILKLNRVNFDKMTVCRVFTMEAALLLNLVELFATYTIVILQFAL